MKFRLETPTPLVRMPFKVETTRVRLELTEAVPPRSELVALVLKLVQSQNATGSVMASAWESS